MSTPVLTLTNVSKRYGDFTAVNEINLSIPQGAVYGFLGPNGAGKTTTIRMILDIIRPDSGQIEVLGHSSAMDVRHRIGYLPEEKGLYKKMKVWAIISYFATLKGLDRRTAKHKAFELLERYGLKDFANNAVESLSKGMGQKVQVLASIAHDPELVILDEPFSGLDPVNQEVLEQLIRDLAANGQTVIFSTHIMQHAERLCERLLLITQGRKVFDGTVDQAHAIIPRRVVLETRDDLSKLLQLEDVLSMQETPAAPEDQAQGIRQWELYVREQADPQNILKHCFENKVSLNRFDFTQASLHDVFVHLVGKEAREHNFR
ncbi:ABC transporter ATP-binding protein [Pseudohongiella spirulinae]|uniref:Putative ABC transporter ATP-binding protein YhaQ n=1 Tax=Pseudohongiella spirulinae TaxID=1249552 RepID=A0A0S2K9D9_9GAMM|nr:ATP-binding cassette domain-containing protein [Pseudohongiella spirulinae]ALO44856.1 Putative ABC transporter ATP-binding protein YhaQ [Pseudohongiella spirulinae]